MSITTDNGLTVDATAYAASTVNAPEGLTIERPFGWNGKKKTIRIVSVRIRWTLDLTEETPKWRSSEKVTGRNVLKDGTLGAPVMVWEHIGHRHEDRNALQAFVHDAIESTRPATVPTFTLNTEA